MQLIEPSTGGARRFGDYVAVRHIATGGMAEIYLARDSRMQSADLQRLFVIKQLLPSLADTPSFLNMFIDEARIARRLQHPNIVRVYDTGHVEDSFFFSMEFLHGHPLTAVHKQLWKRRLPLRLDQAVSIVLQLCAALEYAHTRCDEDGEPLDIVHRDISHPNVHIKYDGTVKLLDFGIAKARNRIEETRAGVLKGKIRYMSPEQAFSSKIDHRSDIFSLSILLWELTTRRQLFDQKADFEVLRAIASGSPTRPSVARPGYPAQLEAIVMKGLEKDPADRYQTAGELAAALTAYAQGACLDTSREGLSSLMLELFSDEVVFACSAPSEYARCVNQLDASAKHDVLDMEYEDIEVVCDDDVDAAMPADVDAAMPANEETRSYMVYGPPTRRERIFRRLAIDLALGASAGLLVLLVVLWKLGEIL